MKVEWAVMVILPSQATRNDLDLTQETASAVVPAATILMQMSYVALVLIKLLLIKA